MYSEEFLSRFWSKVDKSNEGGCWLWNGCKGGGGYGQIRIDGRTEYAHRVSLQIHLNRKITEEMDVAHAPVICHEPSCVNPAHLREATRSENCLDRHIDGTFIQGPVFTGESNRTPRSLTPTQVRSIRQDTRSARTICIDYNVSRQTIDRVKNGNMYKWVTD